MKNSVDPRSTALHHIIKNNYQNVFDTKEHQGVIFPFHLKREFKRYLTCGILNFGMIRLQCTVCQKEKFVAYSCKGRTLCPRCNGRRMADTSKHLVEEVLPNAPIRQWVLSMPFNHRFTLSSDQKLLSTTLQIFHRAITTHYLKKAKTKKLTLPKTGAVTVIEKFGGALNLNIHFHSLYLDGVYHQKENQEHFHEIIPTNEEIQKLTIILNKRINRAFKRRGYLNNEEEFENENNNTNSIQLDLIKSHSVTNTNEDFQKPEAIGKFWNPPFVEFMGEKSFNSEGFSLHANTKIKRNSRQSLEKLCRYITRGAIAKERISQDKKGMVVLKLKSQYTDGTTHLKFTPEQFIKRIISLIPPPKVNLIRYHGVFAPRHRKRSEITSKTKLIKKESKQKKNQKVYKTPWAKLMKHVFQYEVDICDSCGCKLKYISSITSPVVCRRIIKHLNLETEFDKSLPARAPPTLQFEQPILELDDFDQSTSW